MKHDDFKNLLVTEDETVTVNAKELQEYIAAYEKCQEMLNHKIDELTQTVKTVLWLKDSNSLLQALLDEKKSKQIHVDLRV